MCGEHSLGYGPMTVMSGIIPACAGSTLSYCGDNLTDGDHPRMCGEHLMVEGVYIATAGSSPHVRGAQHSRYRPTRPAGIIPACAGSTYEKLTILGMNRDHPRMCGEHTSSTGG